MSREATEQLAEIYSSHAQGYATSWGPVIRPIGHRLLQAFPWEGARRVIDLGTGAGTHLPEIRRLARGACVVGVDRAPGMLELARQHKVNMRTAAYMVAVARVAEATTLRGLYP